MNYTLKDLETTVLILAVSIFTYLVIAGYSLPLISGYREAIIVLVVLGTLMMTIDSTTFVDNSIWVAISSLLGAAAITIIIFGLILGSKILFISLALIIFALWAISTYRHAFRM